MCPALDNEFLNDASKANASSITTYRIDVIAAIGANLP
jgi:hypothetical protein